MPEEVLEVHSVPLVQTEVTVRAFSKVLRRMGVAGEEDEGGEATSESPLMATETTPADEKRQSLTLFRILNDGAILDVVKPVTLSVVMPQLMRSKFSVLIQNLIVSWLLPCGSPRI